MIPEEELAVALVNQFVARLDGEGGCLNDLNTLELFQDSERHHIGRDGIYGYCINSSNDEHMGCSIDWDANEIGTLSSLFIIGYALIYVKKILTDEKNIMYLDQNSDEKEEE